MKKPLIVFDVNETLLDLETITPIFTRILQDASAMRIWFANLILYSEALTLTNSYAAFTQIGAAVMEMVADSRGITITEGDKAELTRAFSSMPPHPEVPAALGRLKAAGFRLFTLTDNLLEVQENQLRVGGIIENFERRFSVDESVKRHKPALEAYRYVEAQLAAAPGDMLLVASHLWDTIGAQAAGWRTAFITRPGNARLAIGPQPHIIGPTLAEIADQLISMYC